MKFKRILLYTMFGSTILLSGCATNSSNLLSGASDSVSTSTTHKYAATNFKNVELFYDIKPTEKYIVIGRAKVDDTKFFISRSEITIEKIFKEQAAKIGGNAVINIQSQGMGGSVGTVIRYVNQKKT